MKKISALMGLLFLISTALPAFAQAEVKHVLMVVTSADRMTDGNPTGLWLEEFAVPYLLFKEAGFEVTVASPKGGKAPVDVRSLKDGQKVLELARAAVELEHTRPLSSVQSEEYDAIFLPGGHGTMFDFPLDAHLKLLLSQFAAEDKVLAAICHGPAALVGAKKADGTPLVAGKTVTAFTDEEEKAIDLDKVVPFLLESRLRELGARFVGGPMWQGHVQVDGKLVTGQNPASSKAAAEAVIDLLDSLATAPSLHEVARSDRQWTGVAVAQDNRIFVNYPRWSDNVPFSVGELKADGSVAPFPSMDLNRWEPDSDATRNFVAVQSVVVDKDNFLWILDAANPQFKGIVPGGPKLVKVDLASNSIIQTVRFDAPVIEPGSYLNDVRIDTRRQVAYLTDSGTGAIIVTNLSDGTSRRLLANHSSTHAEEITLTIEGRSWLRNGNPVRVHADGIALDSKGEYLYYQALTGRTLYRIQTRWLRDPLITDQGLTGKIETVGKTGAADGLAFMDGRVYISALESNAIKTVVPGSKPEVLVQSPQLAWPDSFAFGPDNILYVTTSQIHRGKETNEPYKIFKIEAKK